MRRNRFETVDEVQDDAITLELAADGDPAMARVHVPAPGAAPSGDGAPVEAEKVSEPLARKDAFRGAIQLANTMKMPVVVMGDEAAWDPVWGDLYRPV